MRLLEAIRARVRREDGGQVLPLVVAAMLVLIGCAAIVIDVGRVYAAKQQLQNAVNAAALVAGQDLAANGTAAAEAAASAQAVTDADSYSGASGAHNQLGDGVTAGEPTITFKCDPLAPGYTASTGLCNDTNCDPPGAQTPATSTCNAVVISETATVKTTLAGYVVKQWTITRTAVAGERAQSLSPQNIEVIIDNTESMNDLDDCAVNNNEGTPIQNVSLDPSETPASLDCAKAGVETLLQTVLPCSQSLSSCTGATPVDNVGLLVFPALNTSDTSPSYTAAKAQETDCNSDTATDQTATTDTKFGVLYPTWKSYTGNTTASDYYGIPTTTTGSGTTLTTDVYPGFNVEPLENTYRAGGASTSLTLTDPLVEAVDWGQCPARTVTTTTPTTTVKTNTTYSTVPTTTTITNYKTTTTTTTTVVKNPAPPPKDLTVTSTITTTTPTTTTITNHKTTTTYTPTTISTNLTTLTPFAKGDYPGGDFYGLKAYGGAGTSLAGVITEAQYQLAVAANEPSATPGTKNVIVLLSDGQVNNTSSDCSNAEAAAAQAEDADTQIYVIGYGDDTGSTDCTGNTSPKTLLQDIASSGSDPKYPGVYIDAASGAQLESAFYQAGEEINNGNSQLLSS